MKLKDYRKMIGISVADAAAQCGVTAVCWRYWEAGTKVPGAKNICEIYSWSLGNVTPNDFYALPRSVGQKTNGAHVDPSLGGQVDMFACLSRAEGSP